MAPPYLMIDTMSRPSSIYEQLREQLRHSLIAQGDAGDRLPSERQLALDLGVSPVTVSRALQELQNEGVIRRVPGKGTFIMPEKKGEGGATSTGKSAPASLATSAKAGGANSTALPWQLIANGRYNDNGAVEAERTPHTLIVARLSSDPPSMSHEYWSTRATSQLERSLQHLGGRTTVLDLSQSVEAEILDQWKQFLKSGVNSVVVLGEIDEPLNELWGSLLIKRQSQKDESPFAVVQMMFSASSQWPFDAIGFSDAWGAYLATQHLLGQGHRKLAFFSPSPDLEWANKRYASFRRALLVEGIEEAPIFYSDAERASDEMEQIFTSASRLLEQHPDCTAILAANDMLAQAVMQAAQEHGNAEVKRPVGRWF